MNKVADRFTEEVVDQLTEAFTRVAASLKAAKMNFSFAQKLKSCRLTGVSESIRNKTSN